MHTHRFCLPRSLRSPITIARLLRGIVASVLASIVLTACGSRDQGGKAAESGTNHSAAFKSNGVAPVLLFDGTGASRSDVAAIGRILERHHINYFMADSARLSEMGASELSAYRLLIIPGGNFIDLGNNLTSGATANVRSAVQHGLNFMGICAGAFFAGNSPSNGLNLTSGVKFGFYSDEARGIRKEVASITVAAGPTLEQFWEDGPELSGWGAVVGKYPDGTPAIVEGNSGNGWVVLSGVHPEAPASWRGGMPFTTPAATNEAYAWTLIEAALNRLPPLEHVLVSVFPPQSGSDANWRRR
jgi:hypothetical protein